MCRESIFGESIFGGDDDDDDDDDDDAGDAAADPRPERRRLFGVAQADFAAKFPSYDPPLP